MEQVKAKKYALRSYQDVLSRIVEVRKSKQPRISQQKMADLLGIDISSYSRIESGAQTLSLERFFEICFYLKIDLIS